MEPDIAIGLIYYAMERNFPTSPANQEIREALTMAMDSLERDRAGRSTTTEIVSCKECKYSREYDLGMECTRMLGSTKVQRNDFCSYGRSVKIET